MKTNSIAKFMLAGCMSVAIAGCGDSKPATFPVTGVVTLDGKPVADAQITFVGEPPENSAATVTDAEGKYALATFSAGDGARPGHYKIMVTKYAKGEEVSPYGAPPEDAAPVEQTPEAISAAYSQGYTGPPKAGWKAPKQSNDLPMKYASVATSGLQYTVEEKAGTFDIELKAR